MLHTIKWLRQELASTKQKLSATTLALKTAQHELAEARGQQSAMADAHLPTTRAPLAALSTNIPTAKEEDGEDKEEEVVEGKGGDQGSVG